MQTTRKRVPEFLIIIGSAVFVAVLWLSAYYEADIRWLHFFQAWMYVAAVALAARGNRWGYFIGFSAAVFWDYNIFVNTFVRSGLHWLAESIRTGQLHRIDQIIAVPAWVGNMMVVVGSLWGYTRLEQRIASTSRGSSRLSCSRPRSLPPTWPYSSHGTFHCSAARCIRTGRGKGLKLR